MMKQELAEKTSYTVSAGAALAGLTVNEWVALIGVGCAVGTFLVNWWYQHRAYMDRHDSQRNPKDRS